MSSSHDKPTLPVHIGKYFTHCPPKDYGNTNHGALEIFNSFTEKYKKYKITWK